jgi:hypothetical protein
MSMSNRLKVSLIFGIAGFLAAFLIFNILLDDWIMSVSAGVASFITSFFLWEYLVIRKKHVSVWRCAFVGILISAGAHPLTWYLTGVLVSINGEVTRYLTEGIIAAMVLSIASLIVVGWLTGILGAIIGIIIFKKTSLINK